MTERIDRPPPDLPLVELRGKDRNPLVVGQLVDKLSDAEYDVIDALVRAGEIGLSLRELETWSQRKDPTKALRRLKYSSPLWSCVIRFAARPRGRYRLSFHSGRIQVPPMTDLEFFEVEIEELRRDILALSGEVSRASDGLAKLSAELFAKTQKIDAVMDLRDREEAKIRMERRKDREADGPSPLSEF
jgi:hypothetical protein